jgi:hypothetical protein
MIMVIILFVPIIFGIGPLLLFTVYATQAPTGSAPSDESIVTETAVSGSISSLYDRVERSVVQISPQFTEFDIFRTPLPSENTAQG